MRISKGWHRKMQRRVRRTAAAPRACQPTHRFNVVLPMTAFADDSAERISRAG
jgi:hypothetical protein